MGLQDDKQNKQDYKHQVAKNSLDRHRRRFALPRN